MIVLTLGIVKTVHWLSHVVGVQMVQKTHFVHLEIQVDQQRLMQLPVIGILKSVQVC